MSKKVAVIVYSEANRLDFPSDALYETEAEVYPRSKIVKPHIEKLGYQVELLPGNADLIKKLQKIKPAIVFNLVDSMYGKEELCPVIPAMLEAVRIPYTGAGMEGQLFNMDKYLTKMMMRENGIGVPPFQLFSHFEERLSPDMEFPLIVKLNRLHGSVEINQEAVVENNNQLKKRLKYILSKYKGQAIVEKYIPGTEITAMIVDDKIDPIILGEERIMLRPQKYKMYGFEEAWSDEELYDVKKYPLKKKLKKEIKKAFDILMMRDYARFEIIIDNEGNHFFIDANSNPAFGPVEAGEAFGHMLKMYNIPFVKVAKKIVDNALSRFNAKP